MILKAGQVGQYYGSWYIGSLHRKVVNHGIDHVR